MTGVAQGKATVTVTGRYGTESAAASCAVTVTGATTGTKYDPYRIAPVKASGSSATVYDVEWSSSLSRYVASVYKTLNTTTDYIEQADVAAYFEAFETYPRNYKTSKSLALSYGTSGRVVSTYDWGDYGGSSDYSVAVPGTVNGKTYYELDIGTPSTNGSYNDGSSITRGTYRIVAVPGVATTAYPDSNWSSGYAPLCLYTTDHYKSFAEYYNHSSSFGALFKTYTTSVTSADRVVPTTVTYQVS